MKIGDGGLKISERSELNNATLWGEASSMHAWFARAIAEMGAPYTSAIGGGRVERFGVCATFQLPY